MDVASGGGRWWVRLLDPIEQREIALLRQRLDHGGSRLSPPSLETLHEAACRSSLVAQSGDLTSNPFDEHVEIAGRPERRAQPPELASQLVRPLLVDERPCRPQECASPARRDPHLVKILGIRAEPSPRIVGQELRTLLLERSCQDLLRRCVSGERRRVRDGREVEGAIELRPEVGRLRADVEQLLLQTPERPLVAVVDELDLEFAEPLLDSLALHDRHGVVDDLRALGAQGLSPSAQSRNTCWLQTTKMHQEEREQLLGRMSGRAGNLDLDARGAGRDLELPEPAPLLGSMAQRDPVSRQREIGSVEVARDEIPARQLDAFEVAQVEAVGGCELELVFTGLAHHSQRNQGWGSKRSRSDEHRNKVRMSPIG